MSRRQLALLEALRDGAEPANFPRAAIGYLGPCFEALAYRVRMGYLDRGLAHQMFGPTIQMWWTWLGPSAAVRREVVGDPNLGRDFEWLAGQMAELDRKAGIVLDYDAAHLGGRIPDLIESLRQYIRLDEELRTVIVRPASLTFAPQKETQVRPASSSG